MAELCLGIARARLGPAAVVIDGARGAMGACEENRLSRARQAPTSGPPELAIAELLAMLGGRREDIAATGIIRDPDMADWPTPGEAIDIEPHRAHAEYVFRAAGVTDAVAVVCDATLDAGWSAWKQSGDGVVPVAADLGHFPIAHLYSELTEALGYTRMRDEHQVESMARAGRPAVPAVAEAITCDDRGVHVASDFRAAIAQAIGEGDRDQRKRDVAASVQQRLAECLVELLRRLAAVDGQRSSTVCLSGGLFFNTHFTTAAAASSVFPSVLVAPHPGRNGAAVGAALLASGSPPRLPAHHIGSPYLGPAYDFAAIKEALDNCKLSYDLLRPEKVYDTALQALARGRLVGWYHGAMEWGPRALGHRSVLADPFSPHVLDNLNGFLKQRPAHRGYGVSVPQTRLADLFDGPPASPFMQFEYRPRDPAKFRTILPPGAETLRVHSVDDSEPRFLRLLELWGEKSGAPVLVNTSFNGFHEPLVCSPRDAIRVFYGTGLDVLALEDFVLRK